MLGGDEELGENRLVITEAWLLTLSPEYIGNIPSTQVFINSKTRTTTQPPMPLAELADGAGNTGQRHCYNRKLRHWDYV